jgi:SNF2 family DNA or RNA helicase
MVNCYHAIFAELDWSIVNLLQAEDRIYRLGQTHPVTVDYICHDESVDADIAQSLTQKETIINYLVKGGVK